MALHEIKSKYAGSVLGGLWNVINPIVMVFIYWIIFSVGFKVPPPQNIPFLTWFFCAFVAWQTFSDALLSASNSLRRHRNLIKKTVFPSQILPLIAVLSSLINSVILIILLFLVMMIQGVEIPLSAFQVIYYLIAISMLTIGAGWAFSAASALLKDISELLTIVLQLLFWATPIFYRLDMFPVRLHFLWKLNPVFYLTEGFRNSFLYGIPFWKFPAFTAYFWAITILSLLFGGWFFGRIKLELADNL